MPKKARDQYGRKIKKKAQRKIAASPPIIRPSQATPVQSAQSPVQPRPIPPTRTGRTGPATLSTDYSYITADLKNIAVLAGIMLLVLIALTFVIK
ncbi:MAG: hypothetical protein M1136_02215 [Chloroflexi bacterium]|nr:hypothetical protein [Chloroflexota bacterium]MCL5074453.1 hypothetical protein [Chloroflexota bacterium]